MSPTGPQEPLWDWNGLVSHSLFYFVLNSKTQFSAINAVEDGPKNFTAFQNVAKALSGGASAGSAVSGDSNTADTNSALSIHLSPVTVTAMVSVAVALLL